MLLKKLFALFLAASLLLVGCAQTQPQTGGGNETLKNESSTANATLTQVEKAKQKLAALPSELPDLYRSKETSVDLGTKVLENPFPDKPTLGNTTG